MKYCSNCKVSFESGDYCPLCGGRESVFGADDKVQPAQIVDDLCCENGQEDNPKFKETTTCKFNFSKPLCLVFALLFTAIMLFPCINISISASLGDFIGTTYVISNSYNVFEIQPEFAELVSSFESSAPLFGIDATAIYDTTWAVNGVLLCAIGYFIIVAFSFLLFGIIGLFSRGRVRYFFAKMGACLGIIGNVLIIVAAIVANFVVKGMASDLAATGAAVDVSISLTAYPIVFIALLILFLALGIRLLRYLNGISCMNRGMYDIATREFMLARDFKQSRRLHKKCSSKPNRVVVVEKPGYIPEQEHQNEL